MPKTLPVILLALVLCGCAPKTYPDSQRAASAGIALVKQGIHDAQDDNRDLSKRADPVETVILDHQLRSLNTANGAAGQADAAQVAQSKQYWDLFRDSRDKDAELSRFFSRTQRRLWWAAIAIWAGLGVLGVVLGLTGFSGTSAFLMRMLPLSNVFALVRDRIKAAKGPTVNVNIEGAPAGSVTTTEPDPPMLKPKLPRSKRK